MSTANALARPATCAQTPGLQGMNTSDTVSTVCSGGGNVGTWVIRAKVNTLPADANKIAYLWAEERDSTGDGAGGDDRVALYVRGDSKLYFEWWDGASSASRRTTGVSISTGTWYYVHCQRNGDVLSIWVGDPYSNTPSGTLSGVGTGNFRTSTSPNYVADYIVLFRAQTNLSGVDSINGVERFKGSLAFFAGYRAVFTQDQRVRMFAFGVPKRDDFLLDGELTPTYSYTLESMYPETRGGAIMSAVTNTPTFSQTREVTEWAHADPFSLDPTMFDDVPRCVAFWTFQEAVPGTPADYVSTDRINGIQLVFAGDSAYTTGGGSAANIAQVEDGVFGRFAVSLGTTGTAGSIGDAVPLWVPDTDPQIDKLRMPGNRGVTVVAWIKPANIWAFDAQAGLVAGVWGERGGSDGDRQYASFIGINYMNDGASHAPSFTANGHTSVNGDSTPPYSFNYEVAWTGDRWKKNRWCMVAMSFDPKTGTTKAYLNGRASPSARNPYQPGYTSLYESQDGFRVGGVLVSGGTAWGNWLNAYVGGVAVFKGALPDSAIEAMWYGGDVQAAIESGDSVDSFIRNRSRP